MAAPQIERICATAADTRSLRLALLHEVRRVVPFTAYAWLLTDPQTAVGTSPLADVPCLPELPTLIRLKYLTTVNRWTEQSESVALLSERGDPTCSLVWREMQSRFGVLDVASVVFRDRFGCWSFLDLWRDYRDGRFQPAEASYLAELPAPVTTAIRRCLGATFAASAEVHTPLEGPVVLLLGTDLTVRAQTPETDRYLRLLVPPDGDRAAIPAGAYNVAAQLLAVEAGVDSQPPRARLHLAGRRWLTLRAARITDNHPRARQDIAVTIEDCSPPERADLFARVHGLTPRETELLGHLATGADSRTAARALGVAQNTVQDHLKAVFAKTSTHDRRTLLARALGT